MALDEQYAVTVRFFKIKPKYFKSICLLLTVGKKLNETVKSYIHSQWCYKGIRGCVRYLCKKFLSLSSYRVENFEK